MLIAGKTAPGYQAAKLIIKLINSIAEVVNADPATRGRLNLAFLPNYRVSLAEKNIPAADLSEQISTAGKEASGSGNMKLSMNGALTIGTLDGANVEIRAAMDPADFYLFGLDADQVAETLRRGYRPRAVYESTPRLREVIDLIGSGFFSPDSPHLFKPIIDNLLEHDPYLVLADFERYVACQGEVARDFADRRRWHAKVVPNIAAMGFFSSDRTIKQYADEIWHARAFRI